MARHVGMTVIHPGGFGATRRLAGALNLSNNSHVLDIACGKGTSALLLAREFGCTVTGVDIAADLVQEAADRAGREGLHRRVAFEVADAEKLPYKNDAFDATLSQAMLVLVDDQVKTIREAMRVTRPGGRSGWLELSWLKQPPASFMAAVSDVICAYCMLNVHTFEGWAKRFAEAGVENLEVNRSTMEFSGMSAAIADEGVYNTLRMMFRYLTDRRVRTRMKTINRFFREHPEYFGYGIYIATKA
jgi:ubiquinone/menaquinone biosynthesis C-methylase UbiE